MIYIALVILFATLVIGVPVPMCFMSSAAWLLFFGGNAMQGYSTTMLLPYGFSQMNSIVLLAIALFIIAGGIMEKGRIGEKLIDVVDVFVGRIRGGLGVVATVSCAVFGAITGSGCATLSCIGSIMFPRLNAAGYPRGHSAALMANSAVLGMLIPPSSIMILYAWIGGQSVLASFLSTVVPGIILTSLLSIVNVFLLRNNTDIIIGKPQPVSVTLRQAGVKGKIALPALVMPVLVLGGIYGGIMTPTEAAAVACLYAIPVGFFVYKGLTVKGLLKTLIESAVTTGVIMVMLYAVMMLSKLYILEGPSRQSAGSSPIHIDEPLGHPVHDQHFPYHHGNAHGRHQLRHADDADPAADHSAPGVQPDSLRRHRGRQYRAREHHAAVRADALPGRAAQQFADQRDAETDAVDDPLRLDSDACDHDVYPATFDVAAARGPRDADVDRIKAS